MIFGPFERMVALRYLRARKREGFISLIAGFSLLGIGLGVATLIIVLAVMNGFRSELLERILGLNGHIGVYGGVQTLDDFDALAGRIRGLPGVVQVTPTVEGQVMVAAPAGGATGAVVRGVRADDLTARAVMADGLRWQGPDAFTAGGVVIGHRMAEKLGVRLGDPLTLISPQGTATAFGAVPRMKDYPVAGIFDVGMYEYDSAFLFMPLDAAQRFFRLTGAVTQLEVRLSDPERVGEVRAAIAAVAGRPLNIHDWQQANAGFFDAIEVERNVMLLILTLIVLVAAFNIISSLIMLVKDKGAAIAILRTMGATQGMVMRVFFIDGASIGIVGTALGVALGVAFAVNIEDIRQWVQALTGTELFAADIYFLTELPAELKWSEVVTVGLMALAVSFAATLYPSWRAARLDPVEALRYE